MDFATSYVEIGQELMEGGRFSEALRCHIFWTVRVLAFQKGLTICHTNEFVQSHFSDGNPNPISNPTPP
jgi:hypothetical protein